MDNYHILGRVLPMVNKSAAPKLFFSIPVTSNILQAISQHEGAASSIRLSGWAEKDWSPRFWYRKSAQSGSNVREIQKLFQDRFLVGVAHESLLAELDEFSSVSVGTFDYQMGVGSLALTVRYTGSRGERVQGVGVGVKPEDFLVCRILTSTEKERKALVSSVATDFPELFLDWLSGETLYYSSDGPQALPVIQGEIPEEALAALLNSPQREIRQKAMLAIPGLAVQSEKELKAKSAGRRQ